MSLSALFRFGLQNLQVRVGFVNSSKRCLNSSKFLQQLRIEVMNDETNVKNDSDQQNSSENSFSEETDCEQDYEYNTGVASENYTASTTSMKDKIKNVGMISTGVVAGAGAAVAAASAAVGAAGAGAAAVVAAPAVATGLFGGAAAVAATVVGITTGIVAAPVIISGVGFTTAGVAAGSYAASVMSAMGPVAAGSLFASLQSIGAAGMGLTIGAIAGTVGGSIGAGVAAVTGLFAAAPVVVPVAAAAGLGLGGAAVAATVGGVVGGGAVAGVAALIKGKRKEGSRLAEIKDRVLFLPKKAGILLYRPPKVGASEEDSPKQEVEITPLDIQSLIQMNEVPISALKLTKEKKM